MSLFEKISFNLSISHVKNVIEKYLIKYQDLHNSINHKVIVQIRIIYAVSELFTLTSTGDNRFDGSKYLFVKRDNIKNLKKMA